MCSPNDNVRLILVKIITTVATRCQILRLKFTKFDFSLDSAPMLAQGVLPRPSTAGFKGPTCEWKEGTGRKG